MGLGAGRTPASATNRMPGMRTGMEVVAYRLRRRWCSNFMMAEREGHLPLALAGL